MRDELADQFRRMLEVGIHHDDGIRGAGVQSRTQRRLVSKVAGEVQGTDSGIGSAQLL